MPSLVRTYLARACAFTVLAVVALISTGCGQEDVRRHGAEGLRVDYGGLLYQVQLSRDLNPRDTEDAAYLRGLPEAPKGETYFGVFIRVDNEGKRRYDSVSLSEMALEDTRHAVYRPLATDAPGLTYVGGSVGPGDVLPADDSLAANGPIRGALVLFRIRVESADNRPLELKLGDGPKSATIQLDI